MERVDAVALVERERELAIIDAALAGVDRSEGAFLLFSGEPGIGKSALLRELVAQARQRHIRVLAARATPIEQDVPFGVAVQLFAPVLEGATEAERGRILEGPAGLAASLLSGGEAQGAGTLQGLRWLATRLARPRRLAIVVDDVQWCDEASLRFLHALAPGLPDLPLVAAVTYRPDTPADRGGLAARLAGLPGVRELRPAPLSDDASATVVRTMLARAEPVFCAACAEASGGNPFLLRELVTTLRDEGRVGLATDAHDIDRVVPHSVAATALVRVARLGDSALHLAQVVAVLGDGAPLELAADLTAESAGRARGGNDAAVAAADALARVGILAPGLPLRFAHPLLGAAVHADMPPVARQLAHARAAAALAAAGAATTAVASHLLLGPRPFDAGAVSALLAAGEEALAREDPLAAERFVAPLLEQPLPDGVRREAETALALAEGATGRPTALARLRRALAGEREPSARARPLRAMCRLHFARGEFAAAAACAREAHDAVGPDHPLSATLVAERIACARFAPQSAEPEVLEMRAQVIQDASAGTLPDDPALLAQVATSLAIAGTPAAQVAEIADVAFGPVVRDAAGWDGLTLAYLAAAAVYTEDAPRAERAIAALDRLAIERGSALPWTHARHWRAELRFRQGRLKEAVASAQESLEIGVHGWAFYSANAAALLTRAHLALGDMPAARAAQALADAADEHALFGAFVLVAQAELLLADGRPDRALATLESVGRRLADRASSNSAWLAWRPPAVLAAMALGEHERAAALAVDDLQEARRIGLRGRIGAALRGRALTTADIEARTVLLEEAVAMLGPAIDRFELASALTDLGALHARRGRMADAREPLIRGAELARECGAVPLTERAEAALAAVGTRGTDRDALTATERQIARLAADGLTNRQIAGRLLITPKTVEWHLTHAYAKLGLSSRHELADALGRPVT